MKGGHWRMCFTKTKESISLGVPKKAWGPENVRSHRGTQRGKVLGWPLCQLHLLEEEPLFSSKFGYLGPFSASCEWDRAVCTVYAWLPVWE
ncbi:hypothetical protein VULLAG_LOCUS4155 [Vulpes lagopus]